MEGQSTPFFLPSKYCMQNVFGQMERAVALSKLNHAWNWVNFHARR